MLKNQLNVAAEQSQRKEQAQVAMRDKLTAANLLAFGVNKLSRGYSMKMTRFAAGIR